MAVHCPCFIQLYVLRYTIEFGAAKKRMFRLDAHSDPPSVVIAEVSCLQVSDQVDVPVYHFTSACLPTLRGEHCSVVGGRRGLDTIYQMDDSRVGVLSFTI